VFVGCDKQEGRIPSGLAVEQQPVQHRKPEARVIIPESVKDKWKAVQIAILDKQTSREDLHIVPLDTEFVVPGSGLTLRVSNFLPAFIMEGTILTSVSNEPKNPAVQVEISEQGKKVFQGWLFSLYPGTHAFHHPRYSFMLVDFFPAG
jgi:hypothetical protein